MIGQVTTLLKCIAGAQKGYINPIEERKGLQREKINTLTCVLSNNVPPAEVLKD